LTGAREPARADGDEGDVDRPGASPAKLRLRAELLERTRRFFAERGALEVDTPLLSRGVVVDRHLDPPRCDGLDGGEGTDGERWLQTSPEAFMKRLLAAGSGPIYQIAHAFRCGERGRLHNPEFAIVEWYRPGFDHHRLMDEVGDWIRELLGPERVSTPEKITYAELFARELGIDALEADIDELRAKARAEGIDCSDGFAASADRDAWLDVLLSTSIQPRLGRERPVFVHAYPASQAALARLDANDSRVAERFELFIDGLELCNGYHELVDADEQRARFEEANRQRQSDGKAPLPIDERFLAALADMPSCAGVAAGFDRVMMLACGASTLDAVLPFPAEWV